MKKIMCFLFLVLYIRNLGLARVILIFWYVFFDKFYSFRLALKFMIHFQLIIGCYVRCESKVIFSYVYPVIAILSVKKTYLFPWMIFSCPYQLPTLMALPLDSVLCSIDLYDYLLCKKTLFWPIQVYCPSKSWISILKLFWIYSSTSDHPYFVYFSYEFLDQLVNLYKNFSWNFYYNCVESMNLFVEK